MTTPVAGQPVRIDQPKDPATDTTTFTNTNQPKVDYMAAFKSKPSTSLTKQSSLLVARQTTHNGIPAVIFKDRDYYGVMVDDCKLTLFGKFTYGQPRIEEIRETFLEQIPLKGKVKIGVCDYRHVFIDFNTETNFNEVYFR